MGLETAALIAFTALRAGAAYNEGEAKAKAIAQEGTIKAKNKAQETILASARLKQSFLSSGLTLEGTPMSVINETLFTGREDTLQIVRNANTSSKAAITAGRNAAIAAIGQSFALASFGGMGAGAPESLGSIPTTAAPSLASSQAAGFAGSTDWGISGTGGLY